MFYRQKLPCPWLACAFLVTSLLYAASAPLAQDQPVPADYLSLREYICRVLAQNETLQVRLLEMEVNRQAVKGERGIFEPEIFAGYDHEQNKRETTLQEQISTRTSLFKEENNIYNAGLEGLLPIGTRLRLGYTLRDLRNNLSPLSFNNLFGNTYSPILSNHQYASFAGLSVVQPLLKNFGLNATMAKIRLAAISSDMAYQDWRRQMMLTISKAEAAYWNLYLAQEQLLFFKDSVAVAENLLKDNQERLKAGKGSELEVLEAQSGLALRTSKQAEARQKYLEALHFLTMLYSDSVVTSNQVVVAIDEPDVNTNTWSFFQGWQSAFDLNPDYLIQRKKLVAENVRLAYAKNQRLPQLDLKGSYGLNGLGDTAEVSMDHLKTGSFPSWAVGVEMRVPIGGGTKSRAELTATKLRQKQALLSLKELETQIANALDNAIQKALTARTTASSYQTAIEFNRNLLQAQIAGLAVGKVESRKVLEVEADLFEARNSLVEAKVQYQRALLEQELMQGSILKARNIEISQADLQERTRYLMRGASISEDQLRSVLHDLQLRYIDKTAPMNLSSENNARELLDKPEPLTEAPPVAVPPPAPTRPMNPDEYENALRVLRESLANPQPTPKP